MKKSSIAKSVSALWMLALVAAGSLAQEQHRMIQASDLKWVDFPALPRGAQVAVIEGPPNQEVPVTVRVRFPANYRLPAHTHPVVERMTVLSGTVYMGMGTKLDEQASQVLGTGGVMILPAWHPHYVWTREPAEVQIHGTGPFATLYVDPADDPRNPSTVGELLDRGGRKLTPAELRSALAGTTIAGTSPVASARFELNYANDGALSGWLHDRKNAVQGRWSIGDDGRACVGMVDVNGTPHPWCAHFLRLGEAYYAAPYDDRPTPVQMRELRRTAP